MGLHTSLYPSLTYGLMATAMTEKQCNEAFIPIRNKILPKLSVCRSAPAALVHGPVELGGMGIKDLYTLQGIAHIKALVEEGSTESATGKLIRTLIEYHMLETGLGESIFDTPYEAMKDCMTDTWIKSTVKFIDESSIKIKSPMEPLSKWTDDDTFIINDAMESGFSGKALSAINRCRMHLRSVTRSDIGLHVIDDGALEVKYVANECNLSSTAYRWPPQPRPPLKDRRIWHQFLRRAYDIGDENREFATPGGRWTREAVTVSSWAFNRESNRLYERIGKSKWSVWQATRRRRHSEGVYKPDTINDTERLPPNSVIAVVSTDRPNTRAQVLHLEEAQNEQILEREQHQGVATLAEQLECVHPSLQWAIEDISLPDDNGEEIANAILTGDGRCMSDGSLKDDFGTSAFTVLLKNATNRYEGQNRVPGEDDEQSSYRSELCGILGNLIIMNAICSIHGITEPCEMIVGSDSESALWNAFGDAEVSTKMASADIVAAAREQIRVSPLTWKSKWVKGHQDEKGKTTVLDEWATTNVRCDELATEKWEATMEIDSANPRPVVDTLLGETWTLWLDDRKRSTNLDEALYRHAKADDIISYWAKVGRIATEDTFDFIDWDGYKAATKAFRTRQIWLAKHFSGWGGSGVMMSRRKERDHAACHKCGIPETTIHTVQCQHATSKATYASLRKPLKTWLTKTTSLAIMKAVLCHIDAYQENRSVVGIGEFDQDTRAPALYQATIGPRSFGEGLLSRHWQLAQRRYNLQKGGHETSKRWVSKLIQHLWDISWNMWDKRNDEIHNSATVRTDIHSAGIISKIELLKAQSKFSFILSKEERDFFNMPLATITRKRERNQLEWIARGEQFLNSSRLSLRLQNSRGMMYRWLESEGGHRRQRRRLITDHMEPATERITDTIDDIVPTETSENPTDTRNIEITPNIQNIQNIQNTTNTQNTQNLQNLQNTQNTQNIQH